MNAQYYSSYYNMIVPTLCDHFNIVSFKCFGSPSIIFYYQKFFIYHYLSRSLNFDSSRYIGIFSLLTVTCINVRRICVKLEHIYIDTILTYETHPPKSFVSLLLFEYCYFFFIIIIFSIIEQFFSLQEIQNLI